MDANAFIDFYSSKGWKVGSVSMKDWRAAARNWARRDERDRKGKREPYHNSRQGEDMDKLMEELGI